MKEIQELGGHLTISQAARYMHLSPSHKSTASERMAQWKPDEAEEQPPVRFNSHQNSHQGKRALRAIDLEWLLNLLFSWSLMARPERFELPTY